MWIDDYVGLIEKKKKFDWKNKEYRGGEGKVPLVFRSGKKRVLRENQRQLKIEKEKMKMKLEFLKNCYKVYLYMDYMYRSKRAA